MVLSSQRLRKIVGAIENDTLVFLCGAGLSTPLPSGLPSAAEVAKACYDKRSPVEALDASLEWDIDKLAGFFHARGDFKEIFLKLVPWNELSGDPNDGHAAVADLLVSRAAHAALSANFDTMIERWAQGKKINLQGALDGQEAINFDHVSKPLLKFHGCMTRAPSDTLWTQGQLAEPLIKEKIESCSQWMIQNLPGRHLVVVGFWTDWGYLNDVLAKAFTITNAASVTVVDTGTSDSLKNKAKDLWAKLNALSADFEHVQASGDEVLQEIRHAFSKVYARKFYALGKAAAAARGMTLPPSPDALDVQALYDLRRDAEGKSYARAANLREPDQSCGEAALAHISILAAGGTQKGAWLGHSGKTIRVVNGHGRLLEDVRQSHKEPTTLAQPDIVICTGAVDSGVPAKLIATGTSASVVSPASGGSAEWLTLAEARTLLGLT